MRRVMGSAQEGRTGRARPSLPSPRSLPSRRSLQSLRPPFPQPGLHRQPPQGPDHSVGIFLGKEMAPVRNLLHGNPSSMGADPLGRDPAVPTPGEEPNRNSQGGGLGTHPLGIPVRHEPENPPHPPGLSQEMPIVTAGLLGEPGPGAPEKELGQGRCPEEGRPQMSRPPGAGEGSEGPGHEGGEKAVPGAQGGIHAHDPPGSDPASSNSPDRKDGAGGVAGHENRGHRLLAEEGPQGPGQIVGSSEAGREVR